MVTPNLNESLMVGQTGYTLTCDVSGADNLNPIITYLWTRDDGNTQILVGTSSKLILSHSLLLDCLMLETTLAVSLLAQPCLTMIS